MSVCANCKSQIIDRFLMHIQPNLEYHIDCLICTVCQKILNEKCTAFIRSGKIYCKSDYIKEFGKRCNRCQVLFEKTDMIMKARNCVFHLQCFNCLTCDKQLNFGEHFILHLNEIFCRPECLQMSSMLNLPQQLPQNHQQLTKLKNNEFSHCQNSFNKWPLIQTNFLQNVQPMSNNCNDSNNKIQNSENEESINKLVNDFISSPLSLSNASTPNSLIEFNTNNSFHYKNSNLNNTVEENYCKKSNVCSGGNESQDFKKNFIINTSTNCTENVNDIDRRKRHSSISTSSEANSPYSNPDSVAAPSSTNSGCAGAFMDIGMSGTSSSTNCSTLMTKKIRKDKPTQRVRTVLNETQLKILKQMYSTNQRPDTTIKEQLVERTGLSARVIRVWFQNKRCKDKKRQNAIKELQQNYEKEQALHGVRLNGVGPLVANSPLCNDSILSNSAINELLNPVDIRQYQQNPALWEINDHIPTFHQQQMSVERQNINDPQGIMSQSLMNNNKSKMNCSTSYNSISVANYASGLETGSVHDSLNQYELSQIMSGKQRPNQINSNPGIDTFLSRSPSEIM